MSLSYALYRVGLSRHYPILALIWCQRKLVEIFVAWKDFFNESVASHVTLRPSEILFTRDTIAPVVWEKDGNKETLIDLLRRSLWRDLTPPELVRDIIVVHRIDRRGPYYHERTWNDPRRGPGWWALEGNGQLWVLKVLEELGRVSYIEVKHIETMSEEYWSAICSEQVLDRGRSLSVLGSSKQALERDKQAVLHEWRRKLRPSWESVYSPSEDLRKLRLDDYETSAEPRYTKSCAGFGLCHSTDRSEKAINTDDDHRCHRLYTTLQRQESVEYSSVFYEIINWGLYFRVFALLGLLMFVTGCSLKGCGRVFGNIDLFEPDELAEDAKGG